MDNESEAIWLSQVQVPPWQAQRQLSQMFTKVETMTFSSWQRKIKTLYLCLFFYTQRVQKEFADRLQVEKINFQGTFKF